MYDTQRPFCSPPIAFFLLTFGLIASYTLLLGISFSVIEASESSVSFTNWFPFRGVNLNWKHNKVEIPDLDSCPGYRVTDVEEDTSGGLIARLELAGQACNAYGEDINELRLEVFYETKARLHIKIYDPSTPRYEVPQSVIPRSVAAPVQLHSPGHSLLKFNFSSPSELFSFQILRRSTGEAIFDTRTHPLIFEPQYLRVKTSLPKDANIFGLGEHSSTFRFDTSKDTVRTLWARESPLIPQNSNLYGTHPVYFEFREDTQMTHGVFLCNSNGMDVKIRSESSPKGDRQTSLEYNIIGGILDFYFFAGDGEYGEGDPMAVAREYSDIIGTPAMTPYWNLGFHQCRWGYRDWFHVAEVIANYSLAGIPLETMWTDIDYMSHRSIFTVDPENFPLERMQEVVRWLHSRDQRFVLLIDPGVAYQEQIDRVDYQPFSRGKEYKAFLEKNPEEIYKAVVWPGVVAFPDWFHPNATLYWTEEFAKFFDPESGIDIDGAWIDMNEASNFCSHPCTDPEKVAAEMDLPPKSPPKREPPRQLPGYPDSNLKVSRPKHIQEDDALYEAWRGTYASKIAAVRLRGSTGGIIDKSRDEKKELKKRAALEAKVRANNIVDYLGPPYSINNDWPNGISDKAVDTDVVHEDGTFEYDVHNLYGTMMGMATYEAMLARRPNQRPMIVGRSTFPGAGRKIFHWLGDNVSSWEQYRGQIAYMLAFTSIYQIPMVGSDVCGFDGDTTPHLCARWTTLGAFNPFYRNHNVINTKIDQEFYRWPLVAEAAKTAIDIRYRLIDYIYSALWRQSSDGTPAVSPLWFAISAAKEGVVDKTLLGLEYQFLYGDSIMVAPVTEEDSTLVTIYFPAPFRWFCFHNLTQIQAPSSSPSFTSGFHLTLRDIPYTTIPLYYRGGSIIPLRTTSAMTTTELRKNDFTLVVVPDFEDEATGSLVIDDGISVVQEGGEAATLVVDYTMDKVEGGLKLTGRRRRNTKSTLQSTTSTLDYLHVRLSHITFLGIQKPPRYVGFVVRSSDGGPATNGRTPVTASYDFEYDGENKALKLDLLGNGIEVEIGIDFEVLVRH